MTGTMPCAAAAAVTLGLLAAAGRAPTSAWHPAADSPASPIVWTFERLDVIGGHNATVLGAPQVVPTEAGAAALFNGRDEGLFLDVNPIAGLSRFTIEVVFEPAPDGGEEQRFLHIEESGSGNRALVELRLRPDRSWALDTYLRHGSAALTLLDLSALHPAGRWHAAALVFDGETMTHYVDRVREASGRVAFLPLGPGRTSIGIRQNRVSPFKGRIRLVRITPDALPPAGLLASSAA